MEFLAKSNSRSESLSLKLFPELQWNLGLFPELRWNFPAFSKPFLGTLSLIPFRSYDGILNKD
jgi:hypothetical protein